MQPASISRPNLRWVFGFIGITSPEFIFADGIQVGPSIARSRSRTRSSGNKPARGLKATRHHQPPNCSRRPDGPAERPQARNQAPCTPG